MKLACVPLFVAASVLLYFGTTMLFLVPGYPGENYIKSLFAGRFLYEVLPTLSSAALLVIVGWLWNRSSGSMNLKRTTGRAFSFAVAAVLLFWIGLIFMADMRDGFQ